MQRVQHRPVQQCGQGRSITVTCMCSPWETARIAHFKVMGARPGQHAFRHSRSCSVWPSLHRNFQLSPPLSQVLNITASRCCCVTSF